VGVFTRWGKESSPSSEFTVGGTYGKRKRDEKEKNKALNEKKEVRKHAGKRRSLSE